jgi:uncharacterized repeat protein (TIGR01451 family)
VGDTIFFTITVTNNGPNNATGIGVTDLLPAGLNPVSATPSQGSYSFGSGLWAIGSLATSNSATMQLQVVVATASQQTNTASITQADQGDPNPANNSASATVTPLQADLAVAKAVSNATPNVGDTVRFTVTVMNIGPGDATNVSVSDALPAGLTFISATPSQGSYNAITGLWSIGTITSSSSATMTLDATVASPSPQTNTASISHSDQFDPNTGNNSASATVSPLQADLAIGKAVSDATPAVGDTVTYTVTVSDLGPGDATNVTVLDLLPAGLTFISATASQGSYDNLTGVWNIGAVANSSSATCVFSVRVVSLSQMTNVASISHSDQFDPNTGNNTASATITPH